MSKAKLFGVLAEFDTARAVYKACEAVRDAGYDKWDSHTPFPVHNLDKAMGLKNSKLPWIVLAMGLTGATFGMTMQWWVASEAYPLVIANKPYFSWQAFVPVTFELMVLFAALGAVLGMLALNKLPMHYHSLFRSERFERASDDKFFISIEAIDPKFDVDESADFLKSLGATHVELVED